MATVRQGSGEAAFEEAWSQGMGLGLDEAVAYARRARGERKRPSSGWASLTPTERQVVALVVEGLTNPLIGERLFMSLGTVKTHLAHVFTKLGITTRAQLASEAARREAHRELPKGLVLSTLVSPHGNAVMSGADRVAGPVVSGSPWHAWPV